MALILTLLIIVLLLIVLLFTVKSKIAVVFNSIDNDIHASLSWLYPLLRSVVTRENDKLVATVYLMNKRIFSRQINQKQKVSGNRQILRNLNPTDIHVDTRYGFRDPFLTGLTCSAVTMVSEFFHVDSLNQKPDFLAINDYVSFDATAKLNLGYSIMKLI